MRFRLWWTFHLHPFHSHKEPIQCSAEKNCSSFWAHLRRRDNNGEHQFRDGQKSRFRCIALMNVAIWTNLLWNRDQSLQIHYRECFSASFDRYIRMPKITIRTSQNFENFCYNPSKPNVYALNSDTHTLFLSILLLYSQCVGVEILMRTSIFGRWGLIFQRYEVGFLT